MISGISYVVCTPFFGYLADRGVNITALLALGTGITAAAFFFMAPVENLSAISGGLVSLLVSIALQGVGWAAVYLCALVYMLQVTKS
jgi:MFS family permease